MNAAMFTWLESWLIKFDKWFEDHSIGAFFKGREPIPWYQYQYHLPSGVTVPGNLWNVPTSSGGYSELGEGDILSFAKGELKRIREQSGDVVIRTTNNAPVVLPPKSRMDIAIALVRVYEPSGAAIGPQ